MKFVIAYDISNNNNRRKIQKILGENSFSFQKSVYEVELSKDELKKIIKLLDELCEEDDKYLIFTPLKSFSFGKDEKVEFII